ncbi:response regulator [Pelagicoccus sp. NFK12]|uniref:Sensory/regulatory protein RpfC n=1 Tax=Pelagicoccus enzymogenes TaxID=2773457 RepID=A0A927IJM5_9BACT|nr:ATP-binding protein [Pelagicoccus enzymogenes]MBD5781963.1 response regulator [Pelagicoccus enzymogenes]
MTFARRISHLPFHTKVLLPVLAILAALPIITVSLVDEHVEQRTLLAAQERLSAAEAVLLNSLEIRERALQEQFKNAVNEPRFKAVSQLRDANTMRAYLRDALDEFGTDVEALLYTPIDGSPSSSVRRSSRFDLANFEKSIGPNIEAALGGELNNALSVYSNSAYNTITVPVFLANAGYPNGCLSIAIAFGNQAVAELKSLTHTDIILAIDSGILASSLDHETAQTFLAENERLEIGSVNRALAFEEHFHALRNSLAPNFNTSKPLSYVLLSSYETELNALKRTRLLLLFVSAGGIAVSALIIYLLIRRITSPLRLLKEGADAVGRGDLTHRVHCSSNDECGDLARAFNQMTSNLCASRQDLETTVRELRETQDQLIERGKLLRESEQGLRLIIEGARDHAIFTIASNGKVVRWNTASERILGFTTTEAQELDYEVLFEDRPTAKADAEKRLQEAASNGEAIFEDWRRRKDGSLFWADVTLSRLEDGGFVEITRDITARHEAETAMRQAKDAAEASDRAKSEFLANMSHEFRTPMNGIIGMAGLLSSLELTEEQREFTETIRVSADNLLSIIDDVLDISKIEAGELEVSTSATNLIETIEDSLSLFQEDCEKKGIGLHLVIKNEVPASIVTDPNRLRQVIVNVVGNAIKFTHHGGVTVSVDYDSYLSRLSIAVTDTGIGIPLEKQEKLFEPFYQVESSASREFGGTGLGLAISRNLLRLLDGSLSVESEVGDGSTFTISLNAQKLETVPAFAHYPGLRTLLLVDDPIAAAALKIQLQAWGMDLDCKSSNPGPLKNALENGDYQLLLVDPSATRPDTVRAIIDTRSILKENFPHIIRFVESHSESELMHSETCISLPRPLSLRRLNRQIRDSTEKPVRVFSQELVGNENPDTPESLPAMATKRKQETKESESFADQHPLRILVVEDNPINTKVLLKFLKKLGYTAETAANGEEGFAAAESMVFDVVLMDLQMPVMNGLDSARHILSSESIEHPIYISAFTANARAEDREACQEVGMHDFVAKPARLPEIEGVLQRAYAWLAEQAKALS